MTETSMYWLTRLDQIHAFCNGFEFLFGVLSVIGLIVLIYFKVEKEQNRKYNNGENLDRDFVYASNIVKTLKIPTFSCLFATILISLFTVFLPTTKEMVSIKVIPQIATLENCNAFKNISKDLLDLTAKWLEDVKKSDK